MVVRKIIERILEEGQTSITITDTDIPGSLVRTYSNDPDLMPTQVVLTGSTLKIDYEAQTSDKYVAVELVKQGLDIIDNLTSTDTDAALSAKQGKVLKDLVDGITPITELTELDDVSADDPQTGDILKYSGASEKWEKYNLPDIPSYLGDLGDVVLDTVTSGQVLSYNGAYWTNTAPAGGSGSCFIDTSNLITSGTLPSATEVSYTATEDCIVIYSMACQPNGQVYAKINDVNVFSSYIPAQLSVFSIQLSSLLKQGQTIKMYSSYTGGPGDYNVYKLQ